MIDQNIASESESDIDFDFNKLAMRLERSTSIDLISQKSNITNKTNEEEPDDSPLKQQSKINRLQSFFDVAKSCNSNSFQKTSSQDDKKHIVSSFLEAQSSADTNQSQSKIFDQ